MAEPFRIAAAKEGLGRTLRSKRTVTFEAIEGLLANCQRLRDVTVQAVDTVCDDHGVALERRFASDRKHLYRRYLAFCLEDKVLTEEENADLEHLRALLHLQIHDVEAIHDEVAREVYGKAVAEVLADLEVSPEEDAFLRRLRGELHLSEAVTADLLERGRRSVMSTALREASTPDQEFSGHRAPAGEFTGRSEESFEAAVADALAKAKRAIPSLHWFGMARLAFASASATAASNDSSERPVNSPAGAR